MKFVKHLSLFLILCTSTLTFAQSGDCRQKFHDEQKTNLTKMLEGSSLSAETKTKLIDLHTNYLNERSKYQGEIRELRKSIVEKLFDAKSGTKEIKKMKNQLKKLEEKRIESAFNSIDEAMKILKPAALNNEKDLQFNLQLLHHFNNSEY